MEIPKTSLIELLDLDIVIDVVDVGANPIADVPPYLMLMLAGHARVTGFDPAKSAMELLEERNKNSNERYLPYAVGDGTRQILKVCKSAGMTSLLEPNLELLKHFDHFPDWGTVVERIEVDTTRLDDIGEITEMDFLKIDIQGGELAVFEHAKERLSDCVLVHTETNFLDMYQDQPLFSEVEQCLRAQGFMFHRFSPLETRTLLPMRVQRTGGGGVSQVFWADSVFIRDFRKFNELAPAKLLKLAVLLHDIYRSIDVVNLALMAFDEQTGEALAPRYQKLLSAWSG